MVIRQFDVFANPSAASQGRTPFIAVLQSHYLSQIDTVVIAPLHRGETTERLGAFSFELEVAGQTVVLVVSELANISVHRLKSPVASLQAHEDAIRRALDRVFTGF
ncbi:toxin CcdB [Brevundimonas bullata]|uniref:Toxin CcdB n=1 Tax=Brevundimonas bullata TaxID=13160 RepID=A0A7W7N3J7_9CAUL|nr:toxin CcdB [Brevundimonas bullata]MBB6382378.1 toxin CcdB [Brevundimonas bullata]MBD3833121.1 CcdB family protein [Brevundimonas sp.]